MQRRLMTGIAAAGLLACGSAFAQSDVRTPWQGDFWGYVGVNAGESKFRTDCRLVNVFGCDTKDSAWSVYAGGQMSPLLGLELGYTDFGRIRASGGETKAWAVPIRLTVGTPIGERFRVFGKLGGLYGRTDIRVDLEDFLESPTESGNRNGWGWTYGAGASFAVTRNIDLRADWDRYRMDFIGGREDVDMLSAGVQFRF